MRAWLGIGAASAVLFVLIILIAQKTALPPAAALSAAALAGAIPTAVVGITRLARLRRARG